MTCHSQRMSLRLMAGLPAQWLPLPDLFIFQPHLIAAYSESLAFTMLWLENMPSSSGLKTCSAARPATHSMKVAISHVQAADKLQLSVPQMSLLALAP